MEDTSEHRPAHQAPHGSLTPTEHKCKNVHDPITQDNARNPPKCCPRSGIALRTARALHRPWSLTQHHEETWHKSEPCRLLGGRAGKAYEVSVSPGQLRQTLFLTEPGLGGPRSGCRQIRPLVRALPGLQTAAFSRSSWPCLVCEQGGGSPSSSCYQGTDPLTRPPHPDHLPEAPPADNITLGVRASTQGLGGHNMREPLGMTEMCSIMPVCKLHSYIHLSKLGKLNLCTSLMWITCNHELNKCNSFSILKILLEPKI